MKNESIPTSFPREMPGSFPFRAARGNASATLYHMRETKGEEEYDVFRIPYQEGGIRKFHRFSKYQDARAKGNEMLEQVARGEASALTLTADDKRIYLYSLNVIRPTGQPLDVAASHYAEAVKILGSDLVIEAARDYVSRNKLVTHRLSRDAVEEFIAEKERRLVAGKLSDVHVTRLASRLRSFASLISMNVADIKAGDVDRFLDALRTKDDHPITPRTRDNWADDITAFFNWAKRKRFAPVDFDEAVRITRLDSDHDGRIEIYTPDDLKMLLQAADPTLIPFLAIGAFAGLRTSEFMRLRWEHVRFENGNSHIVIERGKVKKRSKSRRIVPMTDNLKAWLEPLAKKDGPIWAWTEDWLHKQCDRLAAEVQSKIQKRDPERRIEMKNNGLRHSFISYRVAAVKNVNQVALESGNSPQVIFSNYRELVTETEAITWFAIMPPAKSDRKAQPKRKPESAGTA